MGSNSHFQALAILLLFGGSCCLAAGSSHHSHFGRLIGSLSGSNGRAGQFGIRGDVYAVDARTVFIKGFSYDGKGRDMVFYGGSSGQIGTDGFVIPNEDGSRDGLSSSYNNQDLTLTLPEGRTLKEVRWITLYSRGFSEHFGEVRIPQGFDYPRPQRLSALSGIHKVSSDRVYVVDAQTFLVPNFTYDGAAPDAFFWVGTGPKPNPVGVKVPDENGKQDPLRRYDSKTLVLTLPGDLTVFDVDWLSIWCQAFGIDFGNIRVPKNLNVPPSLKMLGVAPQFDADFNEMPYFLTGNRRLLNPRRQNQPSAVVGQSNQREQQQQQPQRYRPNLDRPQPAHFSRSAPATHFRTAA